VWEDGDGWQVGPEPLLRIGVVDGEAAYQFDGIAGVQRLENGTVVVADGGFQEVRFYSPDGQIQAVFGGPGEGPGEFTGLSDLGTTEEGRIWAYDFSLRRLAFLNRSGQAEGLTTLGPEPAVLQPVGPLPDGSFVFRQLWGAARVAEADQGGLRRDAIAYVRFGADGQLMDTLGLFPGRELYLSEEDGRGVMSTPPFARSSSSEIWQGLLVVGSQDSFELRAFDPTGAPSQVVRIQGVDLAIGQKELDAYIRERLAAVEEQERPGLRISLESMPVPRRKPAYGSLLADEEGNLWVNEWSQYPGIAPDWRVLGSKGEWLGVVTFPDGFFPYDIGGDWVLGTQRDELDVESVVLLPLMRN
jgi:hypothetical protein